MQNPIMTALFSRMSSCVDFGLSNQVDAVQSTINKTSDALLDLAQSKLSMSDFEKIANRISFVDATGKGLEQVKTIDKIVRFMTAVALDQPSALCNYLRVSALTTLKNDGSVTVRENVCALSKVALRNSDIFAVREGFVNEAGYTPGTGCSQASQSRQVFNVFGFYTGFVKGGKNNKPALTAEGERVLRGLIFKGANN